MPKEIKAKEIKAPEKIKVRIFEGKESSREPEDFNLYKKLSVPVNGKKLALEIAKLIERVDPDSAVYLTGSKARGC